MNKFLWLLSFVLMRFIFPAHLFSQASFVKGKVVFNQMPVTSATITLLKTEKKTIADSLGIFFLQDLPEGSHTLFVSSVGFISKEYRFATKAADTIYLQITLLPDSTMLGNVVITGVSKATLIRENPLSIGIVSSKQLAQTAESNLIDALSKNVNGLNVVKTGPNISKPFIRGLGYNRILTLYDGMRQEGQQWGDEHGIEADAYHIAKAEVIKGPASLQYGSDAIAGVVSLFPFIPKNGSPKTDGIITSEYQSNNNMIGNGFRVSYSNSHLLLSASASLRIAGNYKNAVDDKVYNTGFTEKNFSLLAGIRSQKGYSHFTITAYNNMQGIPDGSRDSLSRHFTKQVSESGNDDVKDRPAVTDKELDSYHLSPLHQHIQHYRLYSHHAYQVGRGDIDMLVGFQQNIRREYNHPTIPEQAGMYVQLNTINYSIRYTAPEWKKVEMTAGINGMRQRNKSMDATDFPIPDYHLFDIGAYLYGKWKKNKWTMSGGIRYDIRNVLWEDFYIKTNAAIGFHYHATGSDTSNRQLQYAAYQKTFSGVSASLGFTYNASEHISFKANIGRGYRAPGITEMASNGLDPGAHIIYLGNKNFEPEFSLQQDVGIHLNYKRITAEANLFNNNLKNYIYLTLLSDANGNALTDAQGNRTFQYQQSSAQLYGMEAWFSLQPAFLRGLRFDNSLSMVYGFNRKTEYKKTSNNGENLPLIPPLKMVSCITKKIELHSSVLTSVTAKVETEYNARQNRFLGLNNMETATPSYVLVAAGLISEIKYLKTKSLQLLVQVNNLSNTIYQSHLSRLKYFEYYSSSANNRTGIYNMGRNVCIKLIMPF